MNKKKNSMGFESMMKPKKNIMLSQDHSKTYDTKGNASSSVTHAKRNTGRNSK